MVSVHTRFGSPYPLICPPKKNGCSRSETASAPIYFSAFSLIELLFVLAIISVLAVATAPLISGIMSGQKLSNAAQTIIDNLSLARGYAVSNNTYVWVGIDEVDQLANPEMTPQPDGIGRLALLAVASKDGTRIYDPNQDISSDWVSKTTAGAGLIQIGKLNRLDQVHIASNLDTTPSETGMARPVVDDDFRIGSAESESAIVFTYPLAPAGAGPRHLFRHVIEFDPQGSARIVFGGGPILARRIEIGLRSTKGNSLVPNDANQAAVQVDGLTGTATIYRP